MRRAIASAIADIPHMTAILEAMAMTLAEMDLSVVLVQLTDLAPPAALPFLAQQYGVDGIKGYALCTTDEQRRELIRNAVSLHKTKGTPYAIKRAIKSLGFPEVTIREHTGLKYNGEFKHDGSKKYSGGRWFNFSVTVYYNGQEPTEAQISLIKQLVEEYKNTRSVLYGLKFIKL